MTRYHFLNECGTRTDLTRLFGRAERGQRVVDAVPAGHDTQLTLVGSLKLDGTSASMTLAGAIDGDSFLVYVERVLGPTLKRGDVVVMDNLSSHKGAAVRRAIEACGASVRLLPAYSPDLNPIEKMWSKVKTQLRRGKARTLEALCVLLVFEAMSSSAPLIGFGTSIGAGSWPFCNLQKLRCTTWASRLLSSFIFRLTIHWSSNRNVLNAHSPNPAPLFSFRVGSAFSGISVHVLESKQ